jgi:5'-phosphate synthase pdxT subunit
VTSTPRQSTTPVVGILAVQGAVASHRRALTALGVVTTEVRSPGDLAGLDGVVLPGGESTTMWHLLGTTGLRQPLSEALAAGLPALGTCAGMILLGRDLEAGRHDQGTLGVLDVVVRRNAFGRQAESFEAPLMVAGLPPGASGTPEAFPGVFIRAPVVARSGPAVEILARVDEKVVAVREGAVVATAFHPELTADTRMHELFLTAAGLRTPAPKTGTTASTTGATTH